LRAFVWVERRAEFVFVIPGGVDHLSQQLFAAGREMQGVGAAVGGASSALDKVSPFELVDEHDNAAARETELVRERLLGEPVGGGDVAQRARVVGLQAEGPEALLVEPAALGAELSQQERWAPG
jgi:hypothetical protein